MKISCRHAQARRSGSKSCISVLVVIIANLHMRDCIASDVKAQMSLRTASAVCGVLAKFNSTGTMTKGKIQRVPSGAFSVVGSEKVIWQVCSADSTKECPGNYMYISSSDIDAFVEEDENPWDVHLHFRSDDNAWERPVGYMRLPIASRCAGAFYTRSAIITAASCCNKGKSDGNEVGIGISRDRWRQTEWLKIGEDIEFHIHPEWLASNEAERDDDICVIKIKKGLEASRSRRDVYGLAVEQVDDDGGGSGDHWVWPYTYLRLTAEEQLLTESEDFPGPAKRKLSLRPTRSDPWCHKRLSKSVRKDGIAASGSVRSEVAGQKDNQVDVRYLCTDITVNLVNKTGDHSLKGSPLVCESAVTSRKAFCGLRNSWPVVVPRAYLQVEPWPWIRVPTKSTRRPRKTTTMDPRNVTTLPPLRIPKPKKEKPDLSEKAMYTFLRPLAYLDWIVEIAGEQKPEDLDTIATPEPQGENETTLATTVTQIPGLGTEATGVPLINKDCSNEI